MTGRLVGYIRVSTVTQTHDQQRDALLAAGVEDRDIFAEKISGARTDRPQFDAMLAHVRKGDTIVVSSFDRFGRNLAHMISTVADLTERGIILRALREGHDTSTPSGQLVMAIFAALAQYERTLIAERTAKAREAGERRGKRGGKPPALSDDQLANLRKLRQLGMTSKELCVQFPKVGRSTLYRYIAQVDAELALHDAA